ncbi:hypothetical protein MPER_10095 [Moniliophthora perniciosa FA553]|nr:hypothetical protein MPER_10095 [Moniliophthora perniciosa FA553]
MSAPKSKAPVVPRPSASLVVVNERNEVLLVQRNPQATAFAGVTVFPGGNYDKYQDESFQMTAIRETFEESDEARYTIQSQKLPFRTFLDEHGLKAEPSSAGFTFGNKQERLPKPDGGQEVIRARFLHPESAIAEFNAQKITFMPPQYYILHTLSSILVGEKNTMEQREKVRQLAYG